MNTVLPTANGEIIKTAGKRTLTFKFGWLSRLLLEKIYGPELAGAKTDTDDSFIANVLMCGLKARAKENNVSDDFTKEDMYGLLDDLSEADVQELWDAAKHSLGFINRLLGLSEEDVKLLAQAALENSQSPDQPTGLASSN